MTPMKDVKTFNIPILYEATGQIIVQAENLNEALRQLEEKDIKDLNGSINHDSPVMVINRGDWGRTIVKS